MRSESIGLKVKMNYNCWRRDLNQSRSSSDCYL